MEHDFDIIVIGGGHAGCEAAHVGARMGLRVALMTLSIDDIGALSCNPAVGGIGKGHLVREIDAMGGLIGRVADAAGIQFRLLNRSKGPAVRGPRAQVSRPAFRAAMQAEIRSMPAIHVIQDEAVGLQVEDRRVVGVRSAKHGTLRSGTTVLTTGTFLGGIIHLGEKRWAAGRQDAPAVNSIGDALRSLGLPMGRLKTGTPPRLAGATVDWSSIDWQPGDADPTYLSLRTRELVQPQVSCGMTSTNAATHQIVRENAGGSAALAGRVRGVGPRYCPSLEDKVTRFPDRLSHQVFLESEGDEDGSIYPSGLSNSLPIGVQEKIVRSIRGLAKCEIVRPGYAIEYHMVDPRALRRSMQVSGSAGLYLAGQINGTTGYEEAAAQGLVAGLNAGLAVQGEPEVLFDRTSSYLGVLCDDITDRGVTEPYRMFTSRAENRLSMRPDNAHERLEELSRRVGCVTHGEIEALSMRRRRAVGLRADMERIRLTPQLRSQVGIAVGNNQYRTVADLLAVPHMSLAMIREMMRIESAEDVLVLESMAAEATYAEHLKRGDRGRAARADDGRVTIPPNFDYASVGGLSAELCAKLIRCSPRSLPEAQALEGMTPAAISALCFAIGR